MPRLPRSGHQRKTAEEANLEEYARIANDIADYRRQLRMIDTNPDDSEIKDNRQRLHPQRIHPERRMCKHTRRA